MKRRPLTAVFAATVVGSILLGACGGGSSSADSNERACTLVKEATDLMGEKGVKVKTWTAKLDEAVNAAVDAKDPKLREVAQQVQDLGKQTPTTVAGAPPSLDLSRVAAVNTLLERCQVYLK